jgi:lipopolysaccharide export system protein LptA
MNIFRIFLTALVLLLVGGVFYWALFVPKEDISQRIYKTIKEQENRADLAFNQVIFEESTGGEKFWQLQAETAVVNKSTGIATLQITQGLFFKRGKPVMKFRSPAALWDMQKKEIYLDKPLGYDVNSGKQIEALLQNLGAQPSSVFNLPKAYQKGVGYWFRAKNLSWKVADQQLVCTGGIVLNKGEITGYAERLTGDVEFKKVLLDGAPRVVLAQLQGGPVTIEANQFEFDSAADLLTAHGSPVITWRDARVSSLLASYHQPENKIILDGDVKISYQDISAWGNSADYPTNQELIILSGEARAEQADSRLSSNKVLVSLKDRKISLLGKSRVVIPEDKVSP